MTPIDGVVPVVDVPTRIALNRVLLNDVDLFSEWEQGMGWDIESVQLTCGANEIVFDHFEFPELMVVHFCARQAMKNVFALPPGMLMVVITRAKHPIRWCGQHLPPSLMGVVRGEREHVCVVPAGWDSYEFITSEDLVRRSGILPQRLFSEKTPLEQAHVPLTEPVTGHFLHGLDRFFVHAKRTNGSPAAQVHRGRLLEYVTVGLRTVVETGLGSSGRQEPQPIRRPDLVDQARDHVAGNLTADLSADDLAQALGVSYRVLNYAFRDSLDISPYQYVLTEKLHAARRLLRTSDISVTEACFTYGFHTPSRFARHYERLFGELPSQTRYPGRS